jgi:hypothetical protein
VAAFVDNDTVLTALPVARRNIEKRARPVLMRAQADGPPVG